MKRRKTPDESLWAIYAIEHYQSGHSRRQTLLYLNENICFVSDAALRRLFKSQGINRTRSETAKLQAKKGLISYDRQCVMCSSKFSARTPTALMCDVCTGDTTPGFTKIKQKKYTYYRKIVSYGLSVQEYEEMLLRQDSRCGLCERKLKRLCVDHCHRTGRIRGLLCNQCNLTLGHVEKHMHNVDWLVNAQTWIETSEGMNAV